MSVCIQVKEARKLLPPPSSREYYCQVQIGNQQWRTKPIVSKTSPVWKEETSLYVSDRKNDEIRLSVWAVGGGPDNTDTLLGQAVVLVKTLETGVDCWQWKDLVPWGALDDADGEIRFNAVYFDDSSDEEQQAKSQTLIGDVKHVFGKAARPKARNPNRNRAESVKMDSGPLQAATEAAAEYIAALEAGCEEEYIVPEGDFDAGRVLDDLNQIPSYFHDTDFDRHGYVLEVLALPSSAETEQKLSEYNDLVESLWTEVVDAHFQGFNTTMESYLGVLNAMTASKEAISKLKPEMKACKRLLSAHSQDLKTLWTTGQGYTATIAVLEKIETVMQHQENLSSVLAAKKYVTAVEMTKSALNLLHGPELGEVVALEDIRRDLGDRNDTLLQLFVSDLLAQLFGSATKDGDTEEWNELLYDICGVNTNSTGLSSACATQIDINLDINVSFNDDIVSINPTEEGDFQGNRLQLVRNIIEAIRILNRVPQLFKQLSQCLRKEVNRVVARSVSAAQQSFHARSRKSSRRRLQSSPAFGMFDSLALSLLLFHTFRSLIRVLQNFIFVAKAVTAATRMGADSGTTEGDRETFGIVREVWSAIQMEMEALFQNILLSTAEASEFESSDQSSQQIRRVVSFHLLPLSPSMTTKGDKFTFKSSWEETIQTAFPSMGLLPSGWLLVQIFRPAYHFNTIACTIMNANLPASLSIKPFDSNLTIYFHKFVLNCYIPTLRRTLRAKIDDIFRVDPFVPTLDNSKHYMMQAVAPFLSHAQYLFDAALRMPHYINELTDGLDFFLRLFFERCSSKFHEATSACWLDKVLHSPSMESLISDKSGLFGGTAFQSMDKEVEQFLFDMRHDASSDKALSFGDIALLSCLAFSVEHVVTTLNNLGGSSGSVSPTWFVRRSEELREMLQWGLNIQRRCLHSVRYELRRHCFTLLKTIENCNFDSGSEGTEAQAFVYSISTYIANTFECVNTYLPPKQTRFVFSELVHMIASTLVRFHELELLHRLNAFGALKMCRNLITLEQTLPPEALTPVDLSHLHRSQSYFRTLHASLRA